MIQQRTDLDWLLRDLVETVPYARHAIVLSADGLRLAQHGADPDTADRLAAACAGLQSLAHAVGQEFPYADGRMRMVVIEVGGGFFYLMAAGSRAYLALLADDGVDPGLVGAHMRDLVARVAEHLSTPARTGEPRA
ncbi:roadblock/LC7 domain-containing protein [Kitasatospora sp. NPDC049285]|uniref:roadblock/LC7 domain-containing protein n=1 Tax=Kitasatospora sp. NPDC049285 TaxID=3157096 RepID=UPI0034315AAA